MNTKLKKTSITFVTTVVLTIAPLTFAGGDQLFKLLPEDGAFLDEFGISVAISGTTAIGGAYRDDGFGSAYLFDTATGLQIVKLLADDSAGDDRFGWSVAISGTTSIVGAHGHDDNGPASGSAYLFDTTTGLQIAKLLAADGMPFDSFGFSVGISGPIAIVGAYLHADNGSASGSAYLFDTTTGLQIAKLLADDGAADDNFGISVAISGSIAIVGARYDDDSGLDSGSAYLFDTTTGGQIAKLLPDDGADIDEFGRSVAISGTIAIVGAWRDDDNGTGSGSAYLFDTTTGLQIAKLLPDDGTPHDRFGWSVAISDTTAIVGAHFETLTGGSAYLFDTTTGEQVAKLLADDGAFGDELGLSVAISGATAIAGAHFDNDNDFDSGSAYLFDAAAASPCPWDLDANGIVGASDLLGLLASWGPCKGCPADFDDNGTVGASDLLALLANWGPCP